jgi:perosamine synthetase
VVGEIRASRSESPSVTPRIRVGEAHLTELERDHVISAINRGAIAHFEDEVKLFEEKFSGYCGAAAGISTTSGTTALHLALAALGIGPGDEVIVPALTMIATINSVTYTGATPVVVDVDPATLTLSPAHVAARITARTRAVIPVHLYGHPADMPALVEVTAGRGIALVEDCAQAHGAAVGGRRVGSLGLLSAFSFYYNKIITTGEGGMVLTSDPDLARRARYLRDQAFETERFVHRALGFNYRMTNLQAAVGVAQTSRLPEIVARKRAIAQAYRDLLRDEPRLSLIEEAGWADASWWMTAVFVDDAAGVSRDELARRLAAQGIETRRVFHPLHEQPLYRDLPAAGRCPVAEDAARRGLLLPSGAGLTPAEVAEVAAALVESLEAPVA